MVLMFSGAHIQSPVVSDTGNLKLLAQVIPNQVLPDVSDDGVPETDAGIIEIRANLPAAQKTVPISLAIDEEPEEVTEPEPEAEVTLCSYVTDEEPQYDGVINEVAWMGSGDDSNAEWVEMQNRTKVDLDVSGWQLVDKAEQIRAVVPAGVILSRNGFLLFERDPHQLPGATVLYKGVIANADEGLRLFDADCGLQDEVIAKSKWPAGTNKPKNTAERGKDLSWHTFYGDDEAGVLGTPGKKNSSGPPPEPEPEVEQVAETPKPADDVTASSSEPDPAPEASAPIVVTSGQIIISEVMARTIENANDEFIELYNVTDVEISLEGFSIKKKSSTGTESTFITPTRFSGKIVPAGGRFVIGHEGQFTGQSQMTWPDSYALADKNNAVVMYNAQGENIDEVTWTEIPAGQSYACASQGSCAVQEVPNPGN
jgi:hypothetical protein